MQPTSQLPATLALRQSLQAMQSAMNAFSQGQGILIADDGTRENEVDYVFAAEHANPTLVNFALEHCRGLVCVSVSPNRANELGIMSAPKMPAGFAHTGFTCSLDAREGISSGISASDRAKTIARLADPLATIRDFVSPGHVFPVTADPFGLASRAGHTEAVLEICRLCGMTEAGVMCEILDKRGDALPVDALKNLGECSPFAKLPIVSTADILWCRLLLGSALATVPRGATASFAGENFDTLNSLMQANFETGRWLSWDNLHGKSLAPFLIPYALHLRRGSHAGSSQRLRIEYLGASDQKETHNGVAWEDADAVISLFVPCAEHPQLPSKISQFADLGDKEGLSKIPLSVKRCVTSLFLLDLLGNLESSLDLGQHSDPCAPKKKSGPNEALSNSESLTSALPIADDRFFVLEVLALRAQLTQLKARTQVPG